MIKIENAIKKYKDQVVLNDLNLELDEFGLVAIRGESGSGKTTLLNCLSGLDSFTSGTVTGIKKGDVSFIFQDFQLIDNLTVKENLLIVTDNKSNEIEEALEKVDIRFPDKKINQLSGGQKQRVAIARALLLNTKYIFADEPTGNLDSNTAENIVKLLKEISKEHLVFVVTHNVELFSKYCDRLITLKDGKIIDDIKNNDLEIDDTSLVTKSKRNTNLNFKKLLMIKKANRVRGFGLKFFNIIFTFILALIIFLSGSFFLNRQEDAIFLGMKESNLSFMRFVQYDKENETSTILSEDIITKITSKFDNYALGYSVDFNIDINGDLLKIKNQYVTNYVDTKLSCGKNKLSDGEVVLSVRLAEKYADYRGIQLQDRFDASKRNYSLLCDKTIRVCDNDLKIVGIDKEIRFNASVDEVEYNDFCNYIYLNEKTFNSIISSTSYSESANFKYYNDELDESYQIEIKPADKIETILGINPKSGNEIVLSEFSVKEIFGENIELSSILNREINVGIRENEIMDTDSISWYNSVRLKVVGISSGSNTSYTKREIYQKIYFESCDYSMIDSSKNIALYEQDLSRNKIKSLLDNGLKDETYLSLSNELAMKSVNSLAIVLLVVCIPLIALLLFFQILYAKQLLVSFKRIIGILKSQLIENKVIIKIFIFDLLFINLLSMILAIILSPLLIKFMNYFFISEKIALTSILIYRPFILILIFVIICLTTFSSLFISYMKLNKKSDIDLVYER